MKCTSTASCAVLPITRTLPAILLFILQSKRDTIKKIVRHIGIPLEEIGNNVFLNGQLFPLEMKAKAGDRLGIFPDDMQLLYKWYFSKRRD